MIWKYLKKDIIGAHSMRIYGTTGTRVSVLKNDNELLLVQDQDHNKFFVKPNDLSDDPQTIQAKTVAKKTRR
jgi:glycerol kinase